MRYLVTGEQMKAIDRNAIQNVGIPSPVLMERAALAVVETAEELAKNPSKDSFKDPSAVRVLAVCGTGNNGADGIAAARLLYNKGYKVTILLAGDPSRGTEEYHLQKRIAENLGIPMTDRKDFRPEKCDILLDAVFGVGLGRPVEGEYRNVIRMINGSGAASVVAVDMPSGIHSGNGQIMGEAVRADVTVTFGYKKLGSVLYPGREYCGEVRVRDIGFPADSIEKLGEKETVAVTYGPEDRSLLPPRPESGNKGTFGKVLVVAGSENMGGAAYLSALAAYRMGAGLVRIMTAEENRRMMQELLPEAVLSAYRPGEAEEDPEQFHGKVERECAWADVIVLGPGIGQAEGTGELMREFLTNAYVPMILDADGLNVIARHPELTQYFTDNIIITPHMGEMSRLTGETIESLKRDPVGAAVDYSGRHGITCVLKDAATVVSGRDGQRYVNESGNCCMAKAGSGDVLTGVIAGILAQGGDPWEAAALGVYLHGAAGDRIRGRAGSRGMLARELADEVGRLG